LTAVVSLGSNLGDRLGHLRRGLEVLAMQIPVSAVSPIYETGAVGMTDQPAFLNLVAFADSDDPEAVFRAAQAAEQAQGRLRSVRWGPRTLDVDVIVVDQIVTADPRLTLPHPRAHERAFVLVPWLGLDREAAIPGRGSVRGLLAKVDRQDVVRIGDPLPVPR
jgi:2-amino-4-hydroxy-6-hydroxymethyldihydropteridine diphosphokinase